MGKRELVNPVDLLGRKKRKSSPITRERAEREMQSTPIVCAALVIPHSKRIISTLRGPQNDLLPNEWIEVLIEHVKSSDGGYFQALQRGVQEELGYTLSDDKGRVYAPRVEDQISLELPGGSRLEKYAKLYVIPIEDESELTPDGFEIIDIRSRRYHSAEKRITGSRYRKPVSLLGRVDPQTFVYGALGAIKDVIEGRWQPDDNSNNGKREES